MQHVTPPGDKPDEATETEIGRVRPRIKDEEAYLKNAGANFPGGAIAGYGLVEEARFVVKRAEGAWIEDLSGNRYIDYILGAGALIVGHAHPYVTQAIARQAGLGTHLYGALHEPNIELGNEMVRAIPCAERLVLAGSGSEATFYAMRMARAFTGRPKILKFEGGYHGNHDYALQSTAPRVKSNFPQGQPDTGGVPPGVGETVLVAPYNDIETTRAIVQENWRDIAAIIVEPVQRNISPQPGFLDGLRRIADEHGLLLIFDEVVTGFRLAYGGGQEYFGVMPDLASYGKIIGGSLSLGAVAGKAEIIDLSDPQRKGQPNQAYVNGTYHGNPLSCAAGCATLELLREPGFYDALNNKAAAFREALAAVLRRHGMRAVVSGASSLWLVVFTDSEPRSYADMLNSDSAMQRKFDRALIRQGINLLPGVRRFISAAHGEAEIEATVRAVDAVCRELA